MGNTYRDVVENRGKHCSGLRGAVSHASKGPLSNTVTVSTIGDA